MGVVNVTPDSFSDGGAWFTPEAAVAHGRELVAQGADLLDVGGESTRPGAERPSTAEELRRVIPVVEALSTLAPVSVDTMRAEVAAAALDAGASLVNDVSGGLADPEMAAAGRAAVGAVRRDALARAQPRHAAAGRTYDDVVADVGARARRARRGAGRRRGRDRMPSCSTPASGSPSTPSTTGSCCAGSTRSWRWATGSSSAPRARPSSAPSGAPPRRARPPLERDVVTAATTVHVARHGVWCVRVHDVVATVDALDVVEALHGVRERSDERRRARPHPAGRGSRSRLPRGLRARAPRGPGVRRRRRARRRPRAGGASDDLADTVNYGEIGAEVLARIEGEPFDLIERLAELVASDASAHRGRRGDGHRAQAAGARRGAVRRCHGHGDSTPRRRACGGRAWARTCREATSDRSTRHVPPSRRSRGTLTSPSRRVSGLHDTEPVGGPEQPDLRQCRGDRPQHALADVAAA